MLLVVDVPAKRSCWRRTRRLGTPWIRWLASPPPSRTTRPGPEHPEGGLLSSWWYTLMLLGWPEQHASFTCVCWHRENLSGNCHFPLFFTGQRVSHLSYLGLAVQSLNVYRNYYVGRNTVQILPHFFKAAVYWQKCKGKCVSRTWSSHKCEFFWRGWINKIKCCWFT